MAGAFHTELMLPAAKALRAVISTIQIKDPRMPVMSNVTGEPMTSAAEIEALLPRQVCEGVLWEKSIRRLAQDGWTRLFELGPGGQLLSISKKIDPVIGNECVHVSP